MSEHAAPTVKPADDPAFKLPASLASLSVPLCGGGLVLLVVGWILGNFMVSPKVGMSAYLTAFIYCLTLTLGCLFFVLIQHLVRAGWSTVVRRIAELVMVMLVPLAILFLPIVLTLLFGSGTLYGWDVKDYDSINHLNPDIWGEKTRWLTQSWFTFRAIIYFAAWIGIAIYFFRGSTEQDETGERAVTDRLQYWSGPAVMAFALITSMAAFDWVMSLAPTWFSTMFGVYMFAGSILSAHCLITVVAFVLQKKGAMRDEVTVEHYHDLGKLIFGFILFWIYISFSQYLLIWYGNIPEETEWFYHRQEGGWWMLSICLVVFHWIIPFLGTMSRHVRRRPWAMCFWGVYLLVLHFFDVFWMIMPEANAVGAAGPIALSLFPVLASVLCVLGMVGLLAGLVLMVAGGTKIIAVRDPRLAESMAFENI
ncbi:hypothetical protein N9N28_10525 [Rubripirellula amarantea]|uniref:Quinol:cytochrome C oxidoreductase n=1 Tax=Rubripirellula amarantea TaxID=2527999 RepID=A0A5C5WV33_9BACT|nr:hypothetical protein [Rubripirellula amarantea]MDA8745055.1 hypothetical protein [Rubripirellula amarantea]TWT53961.1 hypothetical protein Pla22_15950 [Rubripirellula amarantea]